MRWKRQNYSGGRGDIATFGPWTFIAQRTPGGQWMLSFWKKGESPTRELWATPTQCKDRAAEIVGIL
jgi:hypothetical protein